MKGQGNVAVTAVTRETSVRIVQRITLRRAGTPHTHSVQVSVQSMCGCVCVYRCTEYYFEENRKSTHTQCTGRYTLLFESLPTCPIMPDFKLKC